MKTSSEIVGLTADQVYNAGETAFYWKCIPSTTLAGIEERSANGLKLNNGMPTCLTCASASNFLCLINLATFYLWKDFHNYLWYTSNGRTIIWLNTYFENGFRQCFYNQPVKTLQIRIPYIGYTSDQCRAP